GQQEHVSCSVEGGRRPQRSDAAPDYEEIGLQIFVIVPRALHPIHIAPGLAARLPELLDSARVPTRRFIVSNTTVWRLHEQAFSRLTHQEPILLPDGGGFQVQRAVRRLCD